MFYLPSQAKSGNNSALSDMLIQCLCSDLQKNIRRPSNSTDFPSQMIAHLPNIATFKPKTDLDNLFGEITYNALRIGFVFEDELFTY